MINGRIGEIINIKNDLPILLSQKQIDKSKSQIEPVLVTSPTAKAKNYIFDQWIKNINAFKYTEFEVVLFDNTLDGGENANYLNKRFKQLFGHNNGFKAIHSNSVSDSVIERMAQSSVQSVEYAKKEGFRHILYLETDVIPPTDIIEQLLMHQKQIVGALYYRDEGINRRAMIQVPIILGDNALESANFQQDIDTTFVDGTLKRVSHVGLGCVLISVSIFDKINFRFEKNSHLHLDSHFANDCLRFGIPVFCDTAIHCEHYNEDWGIYGKDYK